MRTPVAAAVAALFSTLPAFAGESAGGDAVLKEVTVQESAPSELVRAQDGRANTETRVGGEGIRILGGPGQTNPWKALQMAPSVNYQSADAYGLSKQNSFRIRGKSATHVGRTVNGLPLAGEGGFANGKGGGDLFDMENMSEITLMRGAVPAGSGLGFSNSSVVDMTLRGPEKEFGVEVAQSFGTDNFRRTYVRADSGQLAIPLSFFLSASDTKADKWRGSGDQERQNIEFGLRADLGERLSVELFGVHHEVAWDDFRALSYAQTRNLGANRKFDYNRNIADPMSQRFNRQDFTNDAVLGKVSFLTGEESRLVFKPYYWKERGYSLSGSANVSGAPGVTWWQIVHDTYGFDLRHESKHSWGELTVGYWYQNSEPPPPPTAQRLYRINPDGSLRFDRWSTLAKTERHVFNSPYVSATLPLGDVELTGGVRYMRSKEASFTYYRGNTAPDVSYNSVFDYNPQVDPAKVASGRTFEEWLPNLGVSWTLSQDTQVRASYGRTYGRQNWGSVSSTFDSNRAAFDAAGIRFDSLWANLRPELSDNFDLGARFVFGRAYVAPTLFHTRYKNKQLSLFNPAVGVAYHQSVSKATANGLELEVGAAPRDDLDVYFSYSFNDASYDADARTGGSNVVNVKGKQMQDSPRHTAKIGAVWQRGPWSVAPAVLYIGKRFGDTEEKQSVAGYAVANLNVDYALKNLPGLRAARVGIAVTNLFDKRYVGIINTSDYAVGGLPTYLPGAPRAATLTVNAKF
ncbi:MAG: TonB-dependent receptor [Rhodocyclaceae bacterium]|nr:TonB-dependent receptor [Rhodocyclaceae bacterium]